MSDPIAPVEPIVVAPEPVVEPVVAAPLTNDELATREAAAGAPGTVEPVTPVDDTQTNEMKGWIRANIRWVMAELDWARSGRLADERETLNP